MNLNEYMQAKYGNLKEVSVDENEFIDILKLHGFNENKIETTVKFYKCCGSQIKLGNYLISVS